MIGPVEGLDDRDGAHNEVARRGVLAPRLLVLPDATEHNCGLLARGFMALGVAGGAERVLEQARARRPLLMLPRPVRQHPVDQRDCARRRRRSHLRGRGAARDVLDEAVHPERAVGGRGQQRIGEQQRDRVIDRARRDRRVVADLSVGVQQFARDAVGRQVRARPHELRGDRLLGELAKREAPDCRDRVAIPRRLPCGEQLGGSLTQPPQIALQGDRLGVGVRGGLLERERQITQRVGDGVQHSGVLLVGARTQKRPGFLTVPDIQCDRPRAKRPPVRMHPGGDQHMAALALGDHLRDRRRRRRVVEDQQPPLVAWTSPVSVDTG